MPSEIASRQQDHRYKQNLEGSIPREPQEGSASYEKHVNPQWVNLLNLLNLNTT